MPDSNGSASALRRTFLTTCKLATDDERRAYLDLVCAEEPALRQRVLQMLAAELDQTKPAF